MVNKINNSILNSLDIRESSTNYNMQFQYTSNGSNIGTYDTKEYEEYNFSNSTDKIVNKVAEGTYDISTLKDPTDNNIPGNIQDLFGMWNIFSNNEIVSEVEKKKELNKNKEINKLHERELLNVLSRYQSGLTERDILYVDSNENKIYLKCGFIVTIKNNEIISINNLQNNVVHELEPGKSYFNKIIMNDTEYLIEPPKDADNDKYNPKKILKDDIGNPIDNCLENLFEKYKIFFCPELDAIVEQKKLQNKSTSNIDYADYKKILLGYGLNVDDDEISYVDEQAGKVYLKHGGIILHIKDNEITNVESLITHAKYTLENDKTYFNKVELNNREYSLEPPIAMDIFEYDVNREINPKMIKDELGNEIPNSIQKLYNMSKMFLSPQIEAIIEEKKSKKDNNTIFSFFENQVYKKIVMDNFPDLNDSDILYIDSAEDKVYLKCGLIVKTSLFNGIESIENVNTDTEYILESHTSNFKRINDKKNKTNYLIKDGITYSKIEHKTSQEELDNMKRIINFKDDSDIKINGCAEVYIKGKKMNVYQLGDISDETFLEQIEDINNILNDFPENAYKTIISNNNFKGFVCLSDDYIDSSNSDYAKKGLMFAGLCFSDNYIALNNKNNKMCSDATTTHELCHLFDFCNRSNNNFCVTCQQEFIDLYNEYKIKIQPSINAGYGDPNYYPEGVPNLDEFFAVTGELYINDPDTLSTLFPDIYNYLDEVFNGDIE